MTLYTVSSNNSWAKKHTYKCPICGKRFIGYGNNPYPITDGSKNCCDECNNYVIKMRFMLMTTHEYISECIKLLDHSEIAGGDFHSELVGEKVYFAIFKDIQTERLKVCISCVNPFMKDIVQSSIQNWLNVNYTSKEFSKTEPSDETYANYMLHIWKTESDAKESLSVA